MGRLFRTSECNDSLSCVTDLYLGLKDRTVICSTGQLVSFSSMQHMCFIVIAFRMKPERLGLSLWDCLLVALVSWLYKYDHIHIGIFYLMYFFSYIYTVVLVLIV